MSEFLGKDFKESAKDSLIKAGNILIREADEIVADTNKEKVTEIFVSMRICPGEMSELEISKSYAAV